MPAMTLSVSGKTAQVYNPDLGSVKLDWRGLSWARAYKSPTYKGAAPKKAADIIQAGDVIMIMPFLHKAKTTNKTDKKPESPWRLTQIPDVSAALVSLDSQDGAILALVGGFSYQLSKFNRITQAKRQAGSNFKPFIYSAALDKGYSPASPINDSPLVFGAGDKAWKPKNYEEEFAGFILLRTALAKSRNLISIRLMNSLGVKPTINYVTRFGFDPKKLPRNMTLSLGTADVHPIQITTGFAAFANGGFKIEPYFISHIEDNAGNIIYKANPLTVCQTCPQPEINPLLDELSQRVSIESEPKTNKELTDTDKDAELALQLALLDEIGQEQNNINVAPRIISPENAYLITSMLGSVIKRGTGRAALKMKRSDIAGKTGTTNDMFDAWFTGFNQDIVTSVWMGFDSPRTLGKASGIRETGASAALPMWIEYMKVALADKPIREWSQPTGIIAKRIDPKTGEFSKADNSIWEFFEKDKISLKKPTNIQRINMEDIADLF